MLLSPIGCYKQFSITHLGVEEFYEEGGGGTGFGSISGHSTEESESYSFSTGLSFGASISAPFGIAEAELKTTVEQSMNWGTSSTHKITETWGYSVGIGEDKVIFTSIPFDVYYYRVISSPQSADIGETVTVNVPRAPGEYNQSTDYFNEHTTGTKIDSSVLIHTLGEPFSYADQTQRDTLESESGSKRLFSEYFLQVGTSDSGFTVITLEDLTTETSTYDYDLNVTVEAEISAGGIVAGTSAGFNYGYSYSSSVSTGTWIEGEVPDIPGASYTSDKQFKWGLMAYPKTVGSQQFTIVTYWVDQ